MYLGERNSRQNCRLEAANPFLEGAKLNAIILQTYVLGRLKLSLLCLMQEGRPTKKRGHFGLHSKEVMKRLKRVGECDFLTILDPHSLEEVCSQTPGKVGHFSRG